MPVCTHGGQRITFRSFHIYVESRGWIQGAMIVWQALLYLSYLTGLVLFWGTGSYVAQVGPELAG